LRGFTDYGLELISPCSYLRGSKAFIQPLDMRPRWFGMSTAYTIAKYNMSMCALGHSDEFRDEIAGNVFSI